MLGKEINLLINYPKTKRDINKRLEEKTEKHRAIARKFEKDFFFFSESPPSFFPRTFLRFSPCFPPFLCFPPPF